MSRVPYDGATGLNQVWLIRAAQQKGGNPDLDVSILSKKELAIF